MRVAFSFLAAFFGIAAALMAFAVTFFAPAFVWGIQVMLAWGWIAPFVGLGIGAIVAKVVAELAFASLMLAASLRSHRVVIVVAVVMAWAALVIWPAFALATRFNLKWPW